MKTYSVHICDDHPILTMSMVELLNKQVFVSDVSYSNDHKTLIEKLRDTKVDLLVLDVSLNGASSFNYIDELKKEFSDLSILIYTNYETLDVYLESRKHNLNGFIGKSKSVDEFLNGCKLILESGEYWGSYQIPKKLFSEITPREAEVLNFIMKGNTNQQISEKLSISILTVQTHRKNIKAKLDIESVNDLISLTNQFRFL